MPERIYVDTVVFRVMGNALEHSSLSDDLRERIIVSPITLFEVLSELTIDKSDEVLRQIHAIHNWLNPKRVGLLPWPDDMLFSIWHRKPDPEGDYTQKMQRAFNTCLTSDSAGVLREDAEKLKDAMDHAKQQTAQYFGRMVEIARLGPLDENQFSRAWFQGIADRAKADLESRTISDIVEELSGYHEFELTKLRVAIQNKNYNPDKHKNDLFDAEQLIYLADSTLYFLTVIKAFDN